MKTAVDPAAKASMKMQEAAPAGVEDDGQWPAVLNLGWWPVAAVAAMAAATAASTMAKAVPAMVVVAAAAVAAVWWSSLATPSHRHKPLRTVTAAAAHRNLA